MLFNALALIAEHDLIVTPHRRGSGGWETQGRMRGGTAKLTPDEARSLVKMYDNGEHNVDELAEFFRLSCTSVDNYLRRAATTCRTAQHSHNPRDIEHLFDRLI